jgi:hypothetical protein
MDALEGLFHVAGIEPDQRVLTHFGAVNGFNSDFINGAFAALLFLLSGSAG